MTDRNASSHGSARVLVLGVYFAGQESTAAHVVAEMDRAAQWTVDQRWIGVGEATRSDRVARVTVSRVDAPLPKFSLLNRAIDSTPLDEYDFVLVCDDDIVLPPRFLDSYLGVVRAHDFALSQPARSHDSDMDHAFVRQLDGLSARWTRFVEIGSVFSIRRDAATVLLPFDEASPMGWGYDWVWPCLVEKAGLRLGIVDGVPVSRSVRRSVGHYDHRLAIQQMTAYLLQRPHLSPPEAFFVKEAYA